MSTSERGSQSLKLYMRLRSLNLAERYSIPSLRSMQGKASTIHTPRQAVPGRVVEEQFTRTEHKENTNDR